MKTANPNRFFGGLILVTVLISLLSGCDKQSRHKWLNVFFTGVPPLEEENEAAVEKDKIPQDAEKAAPPPTLYKHPLAASRQCNRCHQSTANFNMFGRKQNQPVDFRKGTVSPGPLVRPRQELCIGCHTDKSAAEALARGLRLHPTSAKGDCYACHDPHQSTNPFVLLDNRQQICIPCHQDPKVMELAAHKEPGGCLTCHNPHLGKDRKLLTKDYKEVRQPVRTVPGLPGIPAAPDNPPAGGSAIKTE
jgi:predicted CXXCH cytochrome family protein